MKKITSIILSLFIMFSSFGTVFYPENAYAKAFSGDFTVTTDGLKRPTVLKKGEGFKLKGTIKADEKIEKIKLIVTDKNSFKKEQTYTAEPFSSKISLSDYADKINFSRLSSGVKDLKIVLYGEKGGKTTLKREFTVLGKAKEPVHITKKCKIKVTKGSVESVTDTSENTSWNSGKMTIFLPDDRIADGILIKWHKVENNYTLKSYSSDGDLLDEYDGDSGYNMLHKYYELSEDAVKVVINLKKTAENNGICTLRVYERDKVGVSVERWQAPKEDECDLMVISAHRDDELLFFGGTIPYYQQVKGKNVYTVYMSGRDRLRIREALAGQWSMGNTTYPIFMNFPGGYHDGVNGTLNAWGGEDYVLERLVEKIRKYKPEVIVTHDINGEYGHPTHKTTSYIIQKAVKLAADKSKYKSSARDYGVWQVKKVYLHLYGENKVTMNWKESAAELDGKTPFQVACVAYDKHISQHGSWSMTSKKVTKYPNNKYGLVYSKVGKDKNKNDFFENIDD